MIFATDMDPGEAARAGWSQSAQHAANKQSLHWPSICEAGLFESRISYRTVDNERGSRRHSGL